MASDIVCGRPPTVFVYVRFVTKGVVTNASAAIFACVRSARPWICVGLLAT